MNNINNGLFTNFSIIEKALQASTLKNNVITNNIANSDTPNFKKSDVQFEDLLQSALAKNSDGDLSNVDSAIADVQPTVVTDNSSTTMREDGNNVDMNSEMSELSKNIIQYNALIQEMNSSFKRLSIAIDAK